MYKYIHALYILILCMEICISVLYEMSYDIDIYAKLAAVFVILSSILLEYHVVIKFIEENRSTKGMMIFLLLLYKVLIKILMINLLTRDFTHLILSVSINFIIVILLDYLLILYMFHMSTQTVHVTIISYGAV
jgi:hypothetical protein